MWNLKVPFDQPVNERLQCQNRKADACEMKSIAVNDAFVHTAGNEFS